MTDQTIYPHQRATVTLTPFGSFVLDRHITGTDMTWEQWLEHPAQGQEQVDLQLWEVHQIFGPHTRSSARLPIRWIKLECPDSEVQTKALKRAREEMARSQVLEDALRLLMRSVGLASDYHAPELLSEKVDAYIKRDPPRVPSCPGFWWLAGRVVEVVLWAVEDGGSGDLLVLTRNNRRKPVGDFEGWQGPAVMDSRVALDDGDIAF